MRVDEPGEEFADATKTPESEHIEVTIRFESSRNHLTSKLGRNGGDNIKNKPSSCVLPSNLLMIVDEKIRGFIQISEKKRQHNVDSK